MALSVYWNRKWRRTITSHKLSSKRLQFQSTVFACRFGCWLPIIFILKKLWKYDNIELQWMPGYLSSAKEHLIEIITSSQAVIQW